MPEDMFSRRNPGTMEGIAADFRDAMERLELGEYARGIAKQASVKLALPPESARDFEVERFAIDDIASDNFRAQKALRNGLPTDSAKWSEIEESARQRSCGHLGLPTDSSLLDIINARRTLALDVHRHALDGTLKELDWQNPEIQFAARLCIKVADKHSPDIVPVLQEQLQQLP